MLPKKMQEWLARLEVPFIPWVFKAHLWALVILAIALPLFFLALPYLDFLNDMAVQPKGKAQSLHGLTEGQALIVERPPVPDTLPMGFHPYELTGKDDKTRDLAEKTLVNPVPRTLEAMKAGQGDWENYCITCHGPKGEGDGKIIGPELFPAPPSCTRRGPSPTRTGASSTSSPGAERHAFPGGQVRRHRAVEPGPLRTRPTAGPES